VDKDGKKIGLALSGGGYRAAAYHIGTLRALNRLGILDKVDVISSVSGGSITAAYYALHKDNFEEFEKSFTTKLKKGVLDSSILRLVYLGIFLFLLIVATILFLILCPWCWCWKILVAICSWITIIIGILWVFLKWQFGILPLNRLIMEEYDKYFFEGKTLTDLPNKPVLTINATEITYNRIFSFSQTKVSGGKFKEDLFKKEKIPLSFAVMASSAFPAGIDPVVFPTEYMTEERSEANKPYLIDGGVYDNQGCHKFSEPNSSFKVDYSIISLAENDKYEYAHYNNSITLLARVINLALNRIDKLQEARNMYATDNSKQRSAYVVLKWNDDLSKIPLRFLQNAQDGYVPMEVMKYHGFDEADLKVLKDLKEKENKYKAEVSSIFNGYLERIKESIGWEKLFEERPKPNEVKEAYEVVTFLTGLSDSEIYSLGRFSEWMTEVQCKLYLPNLL
jgi:NTE family protein